MIGNLERLRLDKRQESIRALNHLSELGR